jgi:hypothetical protein
VAKLPITKLYDKGTPGKPNATDPGELLQLVETFISICKHPAALEYGDDPVPLSTGEFALEVRSGKLFIEVWDRKRSISRRILSVDRHTTGVLDCSVQKFGGGVGKLSFLDLDRPQTVHRCTRGTRESFAEQFRRMLARQFPGWEIAALSSGLDLRRSLSSVFPRARLDRGKQRLAAVGCPASENEADLLTFGLIWLDHIQSHGAKNVQASLCIFLPEGSGELTAHRVRFLNARLLSSRIFLFNAHGSAGEVDPEDLGNIETRVSSSYTPYPFDARIRGMLARLSGVYGAGCSPELGGGISIRHRGLEFARVEGERILIGIGAQHEVSPCHIEYVEHFAARLASLSTRAGSGASGSRPPVFPERWLESCVRAHIAEIDPALVPDPVHGQVLSFAAGERNRLDLLALSSSGRLSVLELKTAEDIHLPVQALDYWIRIKWHAERGELDPLFPRMTIEPRPPKLFLVAPAMAFHPANTTVLRYFSPEIEVERVGINSDWQESLKVILRLHGAESPQSHGSSQ